jgi:hypothetical protein
MWKMKARKIIHDYECHEGNLICVCLFFNFWNENKSAMPITNRDEEKRRWEKQRENEIHKTLNHTTPKTLNQIIESKLDL